MRWLLRSWAICVVLMMAWMPPTQAQPRDRLMVGLGSFPPNMHPLIGSQRLRDYVLDVSRRTVTRFDAGGRVICQLCTEVPTVENGQAKTVDLPNGSKGMEVTFTLRPGLRWGDGTPLTTKDIVFGAEVARAFSAPANVTGVVALDDRSYTVKLNAIRYDFDRVSPQPVNAAIEEPIFRAAKNPIDYGDKSAFNRAPATPGLWNGPYLLTDFKSNESVTFTPNPYWDGEKPFFKQVTMRFIDNNAALQANLLSGDIDLAYGLSLEQILDLQKHYASRFDVTFLGGAFSTSILYFQTENPILADKRVRQAIMLGIDRQTIASRLFHDRVAVANSIIPQTDPNYDNDLKPWPYDPASARRKLAEAGYRAGPDGIMVGPDGTRLSLDLIVPSEARLSQLVEQVIQSQLRQIGIEVVEKLEPTRVVDGETMPKRNFKGMVISPWYTSPGTIPYLRFRTASIPRDTNAFSGYNYTGYSNPHLDAVFTAAMAELDPAKRQGMWNEIQATIMDDLPLIPLYNGVGVFVSPKWMTGLTPQRSTWVDTLWIEYWKPK
jgi:peptide/nickel transport system substrate-binding protein